MGIELFVWIYHWTGGVRGGGTDGVKVGVCVCEDGELDNVADHDQHHDGATILSDEEFGFLEGRRMLWYVVSAGRRRRKSMAMGRRSIKDRSESRQ